MLVLYLPTMRKTHYIASLAITSLFVLFMGCKGNSPIPVRERIAKVWTASRVDANGTQVYTRGGTSNIQPAYTNWKLDLSNPPNVTYTEVDGTKFVGQYSLPDDNTLVLTGLTPPPTGSTNSTLTFTISSIDDNNLKLTATANSPKTGGTLNVYTLTNP